MTVEEARELLIGPKYKNLTDKEIEIFIGGLRELGSALVEAVSKDHIESNNNVESNHIN